MSADAVPMWYWSRGLHDATITKQEHIECTLCSEKEYYRNCLKLYIDARLAMFDTSLSAIYLYNYKVLSEDFDLSGFWWVSDTVRYDGSKYLLRIVVQNHKGERVYLVRFSQCEVEHDG